MLNLEQAVELATKAHEGQWRKSQNLDEETAKLFMCMEEELYPTILSNGNKVFIKNETFVMQKPYITHPLDVMKMMDTEEEKIVAVLHDVIEKCKGYYLYAEHNGSSYYLTKENNNDTVCLHLTKEIYESLVLLTHSKDISYSKYIIDLVKNKLATKVKIADIVCNLADNPSEHAKQKYLKALPILLKGIKWKQLN